MTLRLGNFWRFVVSFFWPDECQRMGVDAHSTGCSPAEEPVDGDLVQAEDASSAAERRGLRRQRLAPFEPSVGEEHPGVCRGRVELDARRPRRCARPDAARLAPEAGALADAVTKVERRPGCGGDGVGAVALDEAPGTVLPVTRRAGARQRGAPALLRIVAEGDGDFIVDDVRRGLEVDGQAPIRLSGSIAVEDGASEASLGDRGVGESGPLPSLGKLCFPFSSGQRIGCPPSRVGFGFQGECERTRGNFGL